MEKYTKAEKKKCGGEDIMKNNYENEKKKVGIITITHGTNYGNRLQNYATQRILEELGINAETIYYDGNKDFEHISFRKRILKKFSFYRKKGIKYIIKDIGNIKFYKIFYKNHFSSIGEIRNDRFNKFNQEYIKYSSFKTDSNNIPLELSEYYDYFLCGSDQIWNPYNTKSAKVYFLTFSNYEKNVAYAPSLGVSDFPDNMQESYSKWISNIKYLSVREQAGADIIKKITGKEIEVLIDPTLMLSQKQWLEIAKEPESKPKNKYILTYFLGGKKYKVERKINYIAKKYKMEIYNLLDYKDVEKYSITPTEFIDLIKDASLVCTDSFHGAVFATIMKVPFITFERDGNEVSMNSRIDNLLSLLNLKCRSDKNIFMDEEHIFKMDYSHVDRVLEKERNKAKFFLCNAFGIKKE